METPKLTIGYWKIRGLIAPVKYMLAYLGVDYEDVSYEQGDAPDFSRECWLSVKPTLPLPFPNLPYLFHGDVKITESQAMMRYIANEFGSGLNLSGKDSKDKANVDMLLSVLSDIKAPTVGHFYGSGDAEAICKIAYAQYPAVEAFLGDKPFLVGDYVTFVDFFFWEQIEIFTFASKGEFLQRFPKLAEYHKRVSALPKFAEYLQSDKFMVRPFNNKIAKLNN
ncbi:hypothetical protein FGO68_gene5684 [Halteria grandinella]|uniref:glutathione transferase n=1 Tax=Halteria grandinella TaxID=5974 RepID=A0A8J8NIK4_HALGN|nr:hypothetical protein FGO68_gene5684 [Halteria grandinella]